MAEQNHDSFFIPKHLKIENGIICDLQTESAANAQLIQPDNLAKFTFSEKRTTLQIQIFVERYSYDLSTVSNPIFLYISFGVSSSSACRNRVVSGKEVLM